jgi:hypothetical protein
MAKIVIKGSEITALQMEEFWNQVRLGVINGPVVQAIIEHRNPWGEKEHSDSDIFNKMIAAGMMIVHRGVKVNRNRTPQEAIAATGRKQNVDNGALVSMPRGVGEVVDLYYVKRDCFTNDAAWETYLNQLGLICDPYAQAADNEANPAFADEHPNGSHWKNARDEWCFSAFSRWVVERGVGVCLGNDGWIGRWWVGGRKLVI